MSPKNLNAPIKTHRYLLYKLKDNRLSNIYKKFESKLSLDQNFIVAVSGGQDSLALSFLTKIYSIKNKLECKYIIVDHKLRKESSQEAKKVKKFLGNFNIRADILTWTGKKPLNNIQSIARDKRYSLLVSKCKKLKISNLIIGHHQDDLIENFFIRMIRGSGLKGLVSFEKKVKFGSINLIRPLLSFKKKELEFIVHNSFNFFVNDPSNQNIIFQRIQIRNLIKEFQKKGLNNDKLFLTIKNLKKSNQALNFYVEQNKKINSFFNDKKRELILNKNFFSQPYEVVFRSLSDSFQLVGNKYYAARGKKIDNILSKIKKNTLKKETLAGCVIKKVNQTVIISKEH